MTEFREQRRADRAAAAEEKRKDRAAAAERRRIDAEHTNQQRAGRAQARRARLAARVGWLAARPVALLLSLIVIVPGVLAVPAMAGYGIGIYGPGIGWLLPAFSEAGMWAFAFATHAARREGRPVGWLLVGVWTFTGISGLLNFTHGHALGGFGTGLVMAVVATGGVIAHQLITAAPMRTRRTRAERRAGRTARIAARRATRMQRSAVRQAVGELAADGTVRLVHQPGPVALSRTRSGRRRLVPTAAPGRAVEPVDELDAELRALVAEQGSEPAGTAKNPDAGDHAGTSAPADEPADGPVDEPGDETAENVAEIRRAIAAGELPAKPSRRKIQGHLGVRAVTAQTVLRALRHGDDGGPTAVAA